MSDSDQEQPAPKRRVSPSSGPSNKGGTTVEVTTPNQTDQEQIRRNLEEYEHLFAVDEDLFDQPTTSRKELWAYYLYYNGRFALD